MSNIPTAGARTVSRANVNDNSNTTFTAVAGAANRYTRLHRLVLSCSTADNLTVKFGTTAVLGPVYMGANSILILDFESYVLGPTAVNEDIKITKGTNTTPVTVFAQYTQEA